MYHNLKEIVFVIFATVLVRCALSLECWKCVADNCEDDPSNNHRASIVTCMGNSACMKVEYSMNTNDSLGILHSVVRTCSAGPCTPVPDEAYEKCTTKMKYLIDGCIRRTCCDDKNLCNSVPRVLRSQTLTTASVMTVFIVTFVANIGI